MGSMIHRKMGALLAPIWVLGVALAATNVDAAVGESIAQLIDRYGLPEGGSISLLFGMATWGQKQGVVIAFFESGKEPKAKTMVYNGVDEKMVDTLLEQNLPKGLKWVNSEAAETFVLNRYNPDLDPKKIEQQEIPQMHFLQTTDGKLWAWYLPSKILVVTNPQYMDDFIKWVQILRASESDRGGAAH
jgi:hypothetical protein